MKRIFTLISILLVSGKVLACVCDLGYTTHEFYKADFVAFVEIVKKNRNEKDKDFYKVQIKTTQLYRGNEIDTINISGYNDAKKWSSCDILLVPGTKWLVFGHKDKDGKISSGYCSMQRVDIHNFDKNKISFILTTLKNNLQNFPENLPERPLYINETAIKTYDSKKAYDYSLVAVKLDSNLNIEKILFYTDDAVIVKNKIEAEINKVSFSNYIDKHKLDKKNGFFYIFEVYPYTSIVQPDLTLH